MTEKYTPDSEARSRFQTGLHRPGTPSLPPRVEAARTIEDAKAIQKVSKAQRALNSREFEQTGNETISTIKISPESK